MSQVNHIQLIEHLATGGSDGVGDADELTFLSNMDFDIVQQLLWYVETHLGHDESCGLKHIKVFVYEYCGITREIRLDPLC